MSAEIVVVRSTSGVLFEMDVPPEGTMPRERYEQQLASGDLVLVTVPTEWVEIQLGADGKGNPMVARKLVLVAPAGTDDPASSPVPAPVPGGPIDVELTADGLALLTRDQLVTIAREAGITTGNKGPAKLIDQILAVVAFADAVDTGPADPSADVPSGG